MTNVNTMKNNLWRIPLEMQRLPQWTMAGKDKAPYCVGNKGLYNASPVQGPWHTFEDACKYAEQYGLGIGFIITEDDPYTCIDMDVKDIRSRDNNGALVPKEQWTPLSALKFYEGTVDFAQSYTELSTSGKGLHTWVLGGIGEGRRGKGFEVYSNKRFMVCTGDVISQIKYNILNNVVFPQRVQSNTLGIADGTAILSSLVKELGVAQVKIDLIEIEEIVCDRTIYDRASNATNSSKFLSLYYGEWNKYSYPSQSEADFALMSMLSFYSCSNSQCRRIFRCSALGQRDKAVKDDIYLNRMLKIFRAEQELKNNQIQEVMNSCQELLSQTGKRKRVGSNYE